MPCRCSKRPGRCGSSPSPTKRSWTASIPPKHWPKNLARHGIDVVLDKVDANGRRIGEVLEAYTISHQVDVLVMGAYGHARWREFILGGATKSLLSKPPLPILFSH